MSSTSSNLTEASSEAILKAKLKAERKAFHEAQMAQKLKSKPESKPQLSKAERRAIQEAQRAAKGQKDGPSALKAEPAGPSKPKPEVKTVDKTLKKDVSKETNQAISQSNTVSLSKPKLKASKISTVIKSDSPPKSSSKKGQIFPHIPSREAATFLELSPSINGTRIHSQVIRAGLLINAGKVTGSTRRCVLMLVSLKSVIEEYQTPADKRLSRDLKESLDNCIEFLDRCRPLPISMRNAVKALNVFITKVKPEEQESKAKLSVNKFIDDFIQEEIMLALKGIEEHGSSKINNTGDVILTFSSSLTVKRILSKAVAQGKKFKVIVVDARPRFPSIDIAKYLLDLGVPVTYVYINAVAYVMKEVTKVFFGAHTILANGYVMAKMGCSQIALVASAYNVPVLVCCETFKFSERVNTDCFSMNESGRDCERRILMNRKGGPGSSSDPIKQLKDDKVQTLDLVYDVTQPDFVSLVITEKAILPCSSVPAVIRRNISKLQ